MCLLFDVQAKQLSESREASVDKFSLMRWPSLSVPPLDDIVTKILEDSQADCDALSIDPFSCEPADSSAKSQSCSSDIFSYEGLEDVYYVSVLSLNKSNIVYPLV
jgi:hypothetical protein